MRQVTRSQGNNDEAKSVSRVSKDETKSAGRSELSNKDSLKSEIIQRLEYVSLTSSNMSEQELADVRHKTLEIARREKGSRLSQEAVGKLEFEGPAGKSSVSRAR